MVFINCFGMVGSGVGSMGALGAGAPMKFLSWIHDIFYDSGLAKNRQQSTHLSNHLSTPRYHNYILTIQTRRMLLASY